VEKTMPRRPKDPLRPLSEEEKSELGQISRASSLPATQVIRAKLILAVTAGMSYSDAARSFGRRSNDAVSKLVSRFNPEGVFDKQIGFSRRLGAMENREGVKRGGEANQN
jgi:hypothetical protein